MAAFCDSVLINPRRAFKSEPTVAGAPIPAAGRSTWRLMELRRFLPQALERVRGFARRPAVRRSMTAFQYGLFGCVVVFLVLRLSEVGWGEVIDELPGSPLFYALFTLRYLALPLTEIPTYGLVWRRPLWRHFSAFLRKRVYNFAVMGYSGEGFFTLWARRTLDLSDREILAGVKDNNLVSALVSNIATAALILALFFSGRLTAELDALPGAAALFALAFASAFGLAIAVIVFRRQIMDLPAGVMPRLVAINAVRIIFVLALHILLYWSALPGPPLSAWFVFVALQLVLSRAPFVPNLDIVFLTAAIHLAETVDAPEASIAGMLVAEAGLSQIFNVALFAATTHLALRPRRDAAPAGQGAADGQAPRGS